MSRGLRALATSLLLMGAAAAAIHLGAGRDVVAGGPRLAGFPTALGPWEAMDEADAPSPAVLAPDPAARGRLRRAYRSTAGRVWVAVDHYPDQREGHRPQSLQLLYPAEGWRDLRVTRERIPLPEPPGATLPVTRLVMRRETERLAVAYWYQVGARASADEHWYRGFVLWNRLVHGRPDSALVRVASPIPDGASADATFAAQTRFIQVFHPALVRMLSVSQARGRGHA